MRSWQNDVDNSTRVRLPGETTSSITSTGAIAFVAGLLVGVMAKLTIWTAIVYALAASGIVVVWLVVLIVVAEEKAGRRDRFADVDSLARDSVRRQLERDPVIFDIGGTGSPIHRVDRRP